MERRAFMDAGGVIPGEGIVGAETDAAIEALERDREHRERFVRVADVLIRSAEPRVQLHDDAALQRMIALAEKIDLASEELDGIRVALLECGDVACPHEPVDSNQLCSEGRREQWARVMIKV